MSKQRLLFEHPLTAQMDRIWQELTAVDRQRIIAILAQMGRATVTRHLTAGKEANDEP